VFTLKTPNFSHTHTNTHTHTHNLCISCYYGNIYSCKVHWFLFLIKTHYVLCEYMLHILYKKENLVFRGLSLCHSTRCALKQYNNKTVKHDLNIKQELSYLFQLFVKPIIKLYSNLGVWYKICLKQNVDLICNDFKICNNLRFRTWLLNCTCFIMNL
jgi:hypothetical protein